MDAMAKRVAMLQRPVVFRWCLRENSICGHNDKPVEVDTVAEKRGERCNRQRRHGVYIRGYSISPDGACRKRNDHEFPRATARR